MAREAFSSLPSGVARHIYPGDNCDFVLLEAGGDDIYGSLHRKFHQLVINNVNTDGRRDGVKSFIKYAKYYLYPDLHLLELPDVRKDKLDIVHYRYVVVRPDDAIRETMQTVLTVWYMVDDTTFATTRAYMSMLANKNADTNATKNANATPSTDVVMDIQPAPSVPVPVDTTGSSGTTRGTLFHLKVHGKQVCHPGDPTLKKYVWTQKIDASFTKDTPTDKQIYFAYQGNFLVKRCVNGEYKFCVNPVAQAIHQALGRDKYKLEGLYLLSNTVLTHVMDDSTDQQVKVHPLYEYDLSGYNIIKSEVPQCCVYEHENKYVMSSLPSIPAHLCEKSRLALAQKIDKFVCSEPVMDIWHLVQ